MRKGTLSSLVVIGALGATALMLSAQASKESVRIPVINQTPQSNPEGPEPKPPPPPPELSAEAKQSILKSLGPLSGPGSLYARVSPRNSFVASKASLAFQNAYWVTSADQFARWKAPMNEQDKRLGLWVKSEAPGRKYLIDCSVMQDMGPTSPFKIWFANNTIQSFASTGGGQHLVFLLDATGAGWYAFQISGGNGWFFYSCEVTRL